MAKMVYGNNGWSFGNKDDSYVLQAGEVVLPEGATPAQILAAFPNFAAGDPTVPPPLSSRIDAATLKILFNHENRVRALEGRAAVTPAQFLAVLQTLLGG